MGLLIGVLGVAVPLSAQAAPPDWVYEAVAPEKTAGGHAAALDAQDHVHIMYGRDALYYDWEDADGWHSETADADAAPASISMALDDAGRPHVVYVDMLTHYLKYAQRDAAGWSVETLAEDAHTDFRDAFACLCLDSAGWPHVGYRAGQYPTLMLKHLGKDGSGWHAATVGSWNGVAPDQLAIGVADDDQPHLGCILNWGGGKADPTVFHAWRDGAGWHTAESPTLSGWAYASQPRFDASGRLHLAYEDDDDFGWEGVGYLEGLEDEFHSEQLVTGRTETWRFGGAAIRVSRDGVPHVVFDIMHDETGLQHWTKIDGVWRQSAVEPTRTYGFTLALDAADQPYTLYRLIDGTMKSARQDAEGWHSQVETSWNPNASSPVHEGGGEDQLLLTEEMQPRLACFTALYAKDDAVWHERVLAQQSADIRQIRLALDAHDNPHIAYNGGRGMGFQYAWHDATGWHTTPLEEAMAYGGERQSDLALDREGRPHIGYLRGAPGPGSSGTLAYVVLGHEGWKSTTVNTNWIYRFALALDEMDQPHFLAREYVEATGSKRLVHIWQDQGGWHQETVASVDFRIDEDSNSFYPNIAVDHAGGLHICYYDSQVSDTLKYGYRSTQGWQLTTVDANGTWVGYHCSLAVDGQNRPHIAYAVYDPYQLRYVRKDATGWQTTSMASGGFIQSLSLGLAPDGTPHICYAEIHLPEHPDPVLQYAWLGAAGWNRMTLENGWAVSSLVFDSEGRPHIACYNDVARQNLSYLWPPTAFHHIDWSPIPSPQDAGVPIPVTLTARNADGAIRTTFTNTMALSGYAPGLADTDVVVGAGTNDWEYPFYAAYHDARNQVIYPAEALDGAGTITSMALEVTTPPGQSLEHWTIRLKHTSLAEYDTTPEWETNGWTVVYQGDEPAGASGWRTFAFSTSFAYNGTDNLLVDFSFNNAGYSTAGECRCTDMEAYRSITASSDSKDGDPLDWSGTSPTPTRSYRVPNLMLGASVAGIVPVAVSPGAVGPFVDGVWIGEVTVLEAVTDLVLLADDSAGHGGESNPFAALAASLPVILSDDGLFGLTDGYFGFSLQAPDGRTVVVEISADLTDWLPLQTNTVGSTPLYFRDPASSGDPYRFYRLLQP